MPYLVGLAHLLAPVRMVSGVVGAIRKDARTATDVFLTTTPHLLCVETQPVVFCDLVGKQTMSSPSIASPSAALAPSSPPLYQEADPMTSRKNTAGAAVQAQPLPKRSQAARPSDWPSAWQAMHVCLVVIEGRLVTLAEVCGKKPDRKARQFDVECAVELALAHIRACAPTHLTATRRSSSSGTWRPAPSNWPMAPYRFPARATAALLKRTRWHFDLLRDLVERVEWQHRRG